MVTTAGDGPSLTTFPVTGQAPKAVVLVLHGGKESSEESTTERQLAWLRMLPVARALHRRFRDRGVAVWLLRNRVRGWNGAAAAPVQDALWALSRIGEAHPGVPVIVVGHSMGGRVAVRVAADPAVTGVAALAPWLPADEPVEPVAGKRVLIAHGQLDRITSPVLSRRWAERARAAGAEVRYVTVYGDLHAMFRWRRWQRVVESLVDACLLRPPVAPG